jgi:hypothetical protein
LKETRKYEGTYYGVLKDGDGLYYSSSELNKALVGMDPNTREMLYDESKLKNGKELWEISDAVYSGDTRLQFNSDDDITIKPGAYGMYLVSINGQDFGVNKA